MEMDLNNLTLVGVHVQGISPTQDELARYYMFVVDRMSVSFLYRYMMYDWEWAHYGELGNDVYSEGYIYIRFMKKILYGWLSGLFKDRGVPLSHSLYFWEQSNMIGYKNTFFSLVGVYTTTEISLVRASSLVLNKMIRLSTWQHYLLGEFSGGQVSWATSNFGQETWRPL